AQIVDACRNVQRLACAGLQGALHRADIVVRSRTHPIVGCLTASLGHGTLCCARKKYSRQRGPGSDRHGSAAAGGNGNPRILFSGLAFSAFGSVPPVPATIFRLLMLVLPSVVT